MFKSSEQEPRVIPLNKKCENSGVKELKKMPSRVLVRPPLNYHPTITSKQATKDDDRESESDEEKEEEGKGLGLIFYDHIGRRSRSKVYKLDDEIVATTKSLITANANSPRD